MQAIVIYKMLFLTLCNWISFGGNYDVTFLLACVDQLKSVSFLYSGSRSLISILCTYTLLAWKQNIVKLLVAELLSPKSNKQKLSLITCQI